MKDPAGTWRSNYLRAHGVPGGAEIPSANVTDRLITERELAERLGVRPVTLAVWRHRRVGPPFVQLGPRTPRYVRADVEAWIESRSVATRKGGDDDGD